MERELEYELVMTLIVGSIVQSQGWNMIVTIVT
jgi:hypothetical protein